MSTKQCKICKEIKLLSCFYKSSSNKQGVTTSCKKCYGKRIKKYTNRNRSKIIAYQKKYRLRNEEKLKKYIKTYRQENKDKINAQQQDKRNANPVLKLHHRISNLIRQCLKRKGYTKRSQSYNILGCSYKDLLKYLNANPYQFKYEDGLYDIDHIIPISNATTEEELIKLNHHTNLQLLPKEYNQAIKKGSPWDKSHFESWLKMNTS